MDKDKARDTVINKNGDNEIGPTQAGLQNSLISF